MYLDPPVFRKYPLKALSLIVLPVLSDSVFLKSLPAPEIYGGWQSVQSKCQICLIYDLGRKAWAKIKAQAGSDHRNCTGNRKLDQRFRKSELFQGFIYMFFLIL